MFGIDTQEKMPAEFLTDHDAWDGYIGHIWYNLLSFANLGGDSCVVEAAPGNSLKLALALAKSGYRGRLYVVDASAEVIKAVAPKYARLLPQAQIHWLCGTLKDQAENLPQRPDYFLGNHILDDMLLGEAERLEAQNTVADWATTYTHRPSDAVQEVWRSVLERQELRARHQQTVESEMVSVLRSLAPAYILLSQYPSSTLADHGMNSLNDTAFSVLETLKEKFKPDLAEPAHVQTVLGANRNFGNAHIGRDVLNAKYWMLCQSKKI
jgi:hypothetical protein